MGESGSEGQREGQRGREGGREKKRRTKGERGEIWGRETYTENRDREKEREGIRWKYVEPTLKVVMGGVWLRVGR